jgi:hypothetical protein
MAIKDLLKVVFQVRQRYLDALRIAGAARPE